MGASAWRPTSSHQFSGGKQKRKQKSPQAANHAGNKKPRLRGVCEIPTGRKIIL
jgi:hypothetical protein